MAARLVSRDGGPDPVPVTVTVTVTVRAPRARPGQQARPTQGRRAGPVTAVKGR